ncbi:MAG: thermonuclease family protein [Rhodobacter sp.]|nr:thermonuclease family protein [Rhodobacter sp.]
MLRLVIVLCLLAGLARAETFSGRVTVVDGDTLRVGAEKVRLYGIDAPELGQRCGDGAGGDWACGRWAEATAYGLYQAKIATCQRIDTDRYGRTVARCFVAGQDIAARLVRDGVAQAYRRYALDYVDEEKEGSIAGRGIWRGGLQSPAEYRAGLQGPAPAAPGGCAIKGNISAGGKIYHMPGQEHYAQTRVSEPKGERWFCSEAEARAAGWRRARR